jgi:ribonuclease HII
MDNEYIIGIDEVGRGPIAGPVAVASFMMPITNYELLITNFKKETKLPIRDSKKLTKKQREKWFEYLKSEKEKGTCDFAVTLVSAEWIDKVGIVRAIQKALNVSLEKLEHQNFLRVGAPGERVKRGNFDVPILKKDIFVFLDGGLKAPTEFTNQQTIIKGDETHPIISLASIVAKVSRDKVMEKYAKEYPDYGFEKHVGYGTRAHYLAIKKLGQTPIHRKSFIH